MRELVYHVATTLDGFIAHRDGSIDGFDGEGDHVADYLAHLEDYDTVVMGRATYEFGYRYDLQPGKRAYPHMRHIIVSSTIDLPKDREVDVISEDVIGTISRLKEESGSLIYLCGGGNLAGQLLGAGLIDRVLLKQSPIVFGEGIPLFGGRQKLTHFRLDAVKTYESGVVLLDYRRRT